MSETLQNILYITAAGIVCVIVILFLKKMLRFARKVLQAALIILALVAIGGYLSGWFDLGIQ